MDENIRSFIDVCLKYTGAPKRMSCLINAIKTISEEKVPGDFVETGVYKGGNCMLMAYIANYIRDLRDIWMYDTFSGMTKPLEVDKKRGRTDAVRRWMYEDRGDYNSWNYCPLDEVKRNMEKTGYPQERVHFIEGDITREGAFKESPEEISILRLDTDFYSSTKSALECLYPKLSNGGFLIIDDYFCWDGARKASDEYLFESLSKIVKIDQSCGELRK